MGAFVALTLASIHVARAPSPRHELWLCLAAAAIGVALDSSLTLTGWISYGSELPPVAPPWIIAIWVAFATTLNVSMRWLRGRYFLSVVLGAALGPLAYLGGARLGALTFFQELPALVALGVGWAVVLPFLVFLAARLDVAPDEPSTA